MSTAVLVLGALEQEFKIILSIANKSSLKLLFLFGMPKSLTVIISFFKLQWFHLTIVLNYRISF